MSASLRPVGGDPADLADLLRAWLAEADPEPVVVRTSGSTGEPKDVRLSRDALLASVEATHARLGGPGRWLLALPTSGVAGLQVVLRSVVAGTDPVVLDDLDDLADAVASMAGDRAYGSLVPTQLHRLDAAGRLDLLAPLDALLVGGAGVDPGLVQRARAAGVTVVRTYGMSETCGGCVYDGYPLDGVRLRLIDVGDDGVGRVQVAGPVLLDGYGDAPRDGDWFDTADLGTLAADGRLDVVGRADDVVLSGGVNVPLPAVERALRSVEGVRDAAAVGVADDEWGTAVVAVIVPADAVCLDGLGVDAVRDAVTDAGLARTWAPRRVVLADAVPLLPGGKPDRLALRSLAGG